MASNKDAELLVNEVNLRLVIDNLLKNSALYASKQVQVFVEQNDTEVTITVEDDGKGIPDKDKESIFIPFARLDKRKNRKTGGLGLGLAITAAAVKT